MMGKYVGGIGRTCSRRAVVDANYDFVAMFGSHDQQVGLEDLWEWFERCVGIDMRYDDALAKG